MRQLLTEEWIAIPADIECKIKSRKVAVKGPKGELKKDFSHLPCEIKTMKQDTKTRKGTYIRIRMWFGTYKNSTSVNTLASLIKNMFLGCQEVSFRIPSFSIKKCLILAQSQPQLLFGPDLFAFSLGLNSSGSLSFS